MTGMRIGIVGCGSISLAYLRNAPLFRGVEIIACADINREAADRRAAEFGVRATDVDALVADKDVPLIVRSIAALERIDTRLVVLGDGPDTIRDRTSPPRRTL